MFRSVRDFPCDYSSRTDTPLATDPRYSKFSRFLSPGWIPGRQIDVSDAQYHVFRTNLPYMGALLLFHPLLRKLWNKINPLPERSQGGRSRLDQRASFDFTFAIFFLFVLHGLSAFKIFFILWTNYQLATKLPRKYVPAATWIFNVGILFANELTQGYRLRILASFISPPTMGVVGNRVRPIDSDLMSLGASIDNTFRGLLARWEVLFNLTILRLISFNLDYYWSVDRSNSNALEVSDHHDFQLELESDFVLMLKEEAIGPSKPFRERPCLHLGRSQRL